MNGVRSGNWSLTQKCHVMELDKSKRRPKWSYKMVQEEIPRTKEEKDLGVVIQDTLSPEQHTNKLFGSIYRMLANIRVAFYYMDKDMMKKILTSMIHKIKICSQLYTLHSTISEPPPSALQFINAILTPLFAKCRTTFLS